MQKSNYLKFSKISKAILFFLVFSLFYFLAPQTLPVRAAVCASHDLSGYAWSERIGWLSFSCENKTVIGAGVDYGVDINVATGNFYGYAWSENIGWINFAPSVDYPTAPNYGAKINMITGKVTGWARACAVFQSGCSGALKSDTQTGGWDGWIKMAGSNYDVTLNLTTDEFEGFAWSDDNIGWISFNHLNCDSNDNNQSDKGNYFGCPAGQPVADYQVTASVTLIPDPPVDLKVKVKGTYYDQPYNVQDPCLGPIVCVQNPAPKFQWNPDGTQERYWIQVDDNSEFSSTLWDSGWVASGAYSDIVYAGSPLSWGEDISGEIYYWRVQTQSNTHPSGWSSSRFMTNRSPLADFEVTRSIQGENILFTFTSTSVLRDNEEPSGFPVNPALPGSIVYYQWDLDGDDIFDEQGPDKQSVQKIYDLGTETVIVTLQITDDGGLQDINEENLTIKYLPQAIIESGDVYSGDNISGDNIDFDSAFIIHARGSISQVDQESFFGDIDFPEGEHQEVNILGKIDWNGLYVCSGNPCFNKYGYEVVTLGNTNQLDNNALRNKVYRFSSSQTINSALSFINGAGDEAGNGLVLIKGDLTINENIIYTNTPPASALTNLASVGWVIKGDLIIDPDVTEIVGAFVVLGDGANNCAMTASGVADSCGQVKTGTAVPDKDDVPLIIRGLLFARRFFFQRAVKTINEGDYAEKVIYDQRLFLTPPPGMEDFINDLPTWRNVAP